MLRAKSPLLLDMSVLCVTSFPLQTVMLSRGSLRQALLAVGQDMLAPPLQQEPNTSSNAED